MKKRIRELAEQAGINSPDGFKLTVNHMAIFRLEKFAALVEEAARADERKALAQPAQEPVGKVTEVTANGFKCEFNQRLTAGTKLYAAPPQRKPLDDEDITKVIDSMPKQMQGFMDCWDLYVFTRAIEAAQAAHGIQPTQSGEAR